MNGAHFHLILNHAPILGSFFALALILYGIFTKSESVIKAALLAVVATALVGIPAYLTGEEAEHVVEPIVSVNKEAIETHEDMAEIAYWSMLMSGAIALGTLFASRSAKSVSMPLVWVNVVMLAIVFVLMSRTGYSGGLIRHNEINAEIPSSVNEHDD